MVRRTLGDVRGELARVAGAVGMQRTDPRIINLLNAAIEELLSEAEWPSTIDRVDFRVYGGCITLPGPYERILYTKVNNVRMQMQSPWFEWVGLGPDLIQDTPIDPNQIDRLFQLEGVLDQDEVVLFKDIPSPTLGTFYNLMIASTTDETYLTAGTSMSAGSAPISTLPSVIVQGLDGNGNWIRTDDNGTFIDGVKFQLTAGSSIISTATSTQDFSKIINVIKPVTRYPLNVYMTPIGQSVFTQIGQWAALETVPRYRRYRIHGLDHDKQYCVSTRITRRFVPVAADNDVLLIGNLPALKAMMIAVYYFETNKLDDYAKNKSVAVDILQKEAQRFLGKQRKKPLITFSEGTGTRSSGMYII